MCGVHFSPAVLTDRSDHTFGEETNLNYLNYYKLFDRILIVGALLPLLLGSANTNFLSGIGYQWVGKSRFVHRSGDYDKKKISL